MIRYLLVLSLIAIALAWFWSGPYRQPSSANKDGFEIHAHRGAYDRPQNTVSAFLRAAELGADMVELDLQITADNVVVVAHDPWLREEYTPEKVYFRQSDLKKVQSYVFEGQTIPTLMHVFEVLRDVKTRKGAPIGINIEIKYDPARPDWYPSREEYAERVLQDIERGQYPLDRLMVQSFDIELLKAVRRLNPTIRISPLIGDDKIDSALVIAQELNADLVTPSYVKLTAEMVKALHQAGIQVIPWTVNDPVAIKALKAMNVDGIITDRPDLAL